MEEDYEKKVEKRADEKTKNKKAVCVCEKSRLRPASAAAHAQTHNARDPDAGRNVTFFSVVFFGNPEHHSREKSQETEQKENKKRKEFMQKEREKDSFGRVCV
eukprot:TRINITY_DN9276_c0_g1_i5.p5 TRINITY_DN9276_c0_g1~~TRINITY_DN9276_c0_g1_i5.p5  ORF type:complete len:103 (+),score=5.75 TRINITY_DN9276_c0_g1_i5:1096-1404(+)